eukprot:CAMPEP_0184860228 /NCGR_PEP_ID=MMETSP0580-20130426/5162_1 /TAXON_ID=1118495 /ORGANISM="Dactyliosolen fragilissimus" /LENGTH=931 /DNA_ID=CAMNT_0027357263 /DNA_START=149 /DNA_END=2943 /DNA_ORIENTATION=+
MASTWSQLPWKRINVGISDTENANIDPESADETGEDLKKFLVGYNHYDDPKADPSELYGHSTTTKSKSKGRYIKAEDNSMDGSNDPGIFLNLDVVDGSMYTVEKVQVEGGTVNRIVIKESSEQQSSEDHSMTTDKKVETEKENSELAKNESTTQKKKKKKNKSKQTKETKKRKHDESIDKVNGNENDDNEKDASNISTKKAKTLKKDSIKNQDTRHQELLPEKRQEPTQDEIDRTQTSWCASTGGVYFHPTITQSLARQKFDNPTPIQAGTLAAAILGKKDIVGSAPTGSGKTLCYILPILQYLMESQSNDNEDCESNIEQAHASGGKYSKLPLTAMILCPTRELALQVTSEFLKLSNGRFDCGTIVGGLALQKQKRVLDIKRPPVLVATPGRLWELMSTKDHNHLNKLDKLRFLVIDEADRMISQGSFPQLNNIFDLINKANPRPLSPEEIEQMQGDEDESDDDNDRLKGLPGIRGEAKVAMLSDDILQRIEQQRDANDAEHNPNDSIALQPLDLDDDEYKLSEINDDDSNSYATFDSQEEEHIHRQTFIFSATLSLDSSSRKSLKLSTKATKNRKHNKKGLSSDSAMLNMLEKADARGDIKVVDFSILGNNRKSKDLSVSTPNQQNVQSKTFNKDNSTLHKSKIELPPGLSLNEIKCTQKHKDSHLYAYLMTTKQGSSGPCLVFCNSIAAVKRVGETLKVLGLPARVLHAKMQQKARLSALESIGKNQRTIVIATDVAARGLDIPSVTTVIHYDVARTIDTFIHRSGRTARGVGDTAIGWSISLVSASEEREHMKICEAVNGKGSKAFEGAQIDGRLLSASQERVSLASKIVSCEEVESKSRNSNKWFTDAAADAGLDLDEDLLDGGLLAGSRKDVQRLQESKRAKIQLKQLLAKPMRKQNFGKFLSGVGLMAAIKAEQEVNPPHNIGE